MHSRFDPEKTELVEKQIIAELDYERLDVQLAQFERVPDYLIALQDNRTAVGPPRWYVPEPPVQSTHH